MKLTFLLLILLTACAGPAAPATPTSTTGSSATTQPARSLPKADTSQAPSLKVAMVYPDQETELENGQNARIIVRIEDADGHPVDAAQVTVEVRGADNQVLATLPATPYTKDTYRTDRWSIPHRTPGGEWHMEVRAVSSTSSGASGGTFRVKPGTSEMLLNKYGFWLDAPSLRGISPSLFGEKGDARNGLIRWGGQLSGGHVLPASIVELHWRTGDYSLTDATAVRRFMLEQLGELGFTRVRELGPFERFQFKQWPAWKVGARGETFQDQIEWVVFYAPEDGRTFALATTVVQPPAGIDAHATLREGFELYPQLHASGTAPEPLTKLAPAPELIGPPIGTEFRGLQQPIVLEWQAGRPLGTDEYYQVVVDYNYKETNTSVYLATHATKLTLPEELYREPNCRVFNWQVRVMRQMGVDAQGQPVGLPVSYHSLYHYVLWSYPPGDPVPFQYACPNAQI